MITLRTACDNRKLIGFVNGVQVITATDSTYRPAQWYFAIRGCVFPTPARYDNFMISPQSAATSGTGRGADGDDTLSGLSVAPQEFELEQNYPNPFNPISTISFAVPKQTQVRLQVFNVLGQLVATLVREEKAPGRYSVTWDAGNGPSGVYFFRMLAGDYARTRKMILAR
ncbi:MAG: T9SS type A sorting domain-containing protein [Ignavibacteria bacterium]|nr:MAG: T9SS type A sorting domain-containing protein [Ignavibacteria bacterium]